MCPRMRSTSSSASYWCAASMNMRHSLVLDSDVKLRFLYSSLITSVNTTSNCTVHLPSQMIGVQKTANRFGFGFKKSNRQKIWHPHRWFSDRFSGCNPQFKLKVTKITYCIHCADKERFYRASVDIANLSVRPSVRYVPVVYENGTCCHSFFTNHSSFISIKNRHEISTESPPAGAPNTSGV